MAPPQNPLQVATLLLKRKGTETTPNELRQMAMHHLAPSKAESAYEQETFVRRVLDGHSPHATLNKLLREYQRYARE